MTAPTLAVVAMAVALGVQQQQQQTPPPPPVSPTPQAAQQADPAKTITLTGCVVSAPDREDMFQLVPAEPEPARPVGTSGTSPAWTVPGYLLLGGIISFAEHANKTVEITGTIEPDSPVVADPKRTGDTTSRTQQAGLPVALLQVLSAKVVAGKCKPKQTVEQKQKKNNG